MCSKVFTIIMVLLAVAMGLLATLLPLDKLLDYVILEHFFEAMFPVLAVAALVKYLFTSSKA